eukprot:5680235-Karenia_brevis.AAC.1
MGKHKEQKALGVPRHDKHEEMGFRKLQKNEGTRGNEPLEVPKYGTSVRHYHHADDGGDDGDGDDEDNDDDNG